MDDSLLQPPTAQLVDLRAGLIDVRELVRASATAAGLPPARVAEVVLAAHEVAMNALTHGRGQGALRVWNAGDELVCEVEDRGPGIADSHAGLLPPDPTSPRGRGLWIARQLCNAVEIESANPGARVRLHVQLSRDGGSRYRASVLASQRA
jgi:anti-sigma regulatory factor (Ser/Thr protein kinase)